MSGQLLVMAVLAAFYPVALAIAGCDIAVPVGLFTGLAVFIPYVGFTAALALALVAAQFAFGQLFCFFCVLLAFPASAILATVLRELRRRYLASALCNN